MDGSRPIEITPLPSFEGVYTIDSLRQTYADQLKNVCDKVGTLFNNQENGAMISGVGFMKGSIPKEGESFYSATDRETGKADPTKIVGEQSFMVVHLPEQDRQKATNDLCVMVDPKSGEVRVLIARDYYRQGHQNQLPQQLNTPAQVEEFFNFSSSDAGYDFIATGLWNRAMTCDLSSHPDIYNKIRTQLSNLRDNLQYQQTKARQPIL